MGAPADTADIFIPACLDILRAMSWEPTFHGSGRHSQSVHWTKEQSLSIELLNCHKRWSEFLLGFKHVLKMRKAFIRSQIVIVSLSATLQLKVLSSTYMAFVAKMVR